MAAVKMSGEEWTYREIIEDALRDWIVESLDTAEKYRPMATNGD